MTKINLDSDLRWAPLLPVLIEIIKNPESDQESVKIAIGHLQDLAAKADRLADLISEGRVEIKEKIAV